MVKRLVYSFLFIILVTGSVTPTTIVITDPSGAKKTYDSTTTTGRDLNDILQFASRELDRKPQNIKPLIEKVADFIKERGIDHRKIGGTADKTYKFFEKANKMIENNYTPERWAIMKKLIKAGENPGKIIPPKVVGQNPKPRGYSLLESMRRNNHPKKTTVQLWNIRYGAVEPESYKNDGIVGTSFAGRPSVPIEYKKAILKDSITKLNSLNPKEKARAIKTIAEIHWAIKQIPAIDNQIKTNQVWDAIASIEKYYKKKSSHDKSIKKALIKILTISYEKKLNTEPFKKIVRKYAPNIVIAK